MLQNTSNLLILILTLNVLFLTNPVSIIITIITQTLLISIIITSSYTTPWFSYILILVFLGGMLVLFSYITSLTPNATFKPKNTLILTSLMLIGALALQQNLLWGGTMTNTKPPLLQNSMSSIFFQDMKITMILAMFLLIILFVVVQITSNYKGPLQSKT